jgi:hypothetical protein
MMGRYQIRVRRVRCLHRGPHRARPLRPRTRLLVAALAASAVALTAGCAADDDDAPDEAQLTGYQQPPEDLCEQVRYDELGRQWDLTTPPGYEPGEDYQTARVWWVVRCDFAGQAEDGRFETEFGEFRPAGSGMFWVHHDVEDAIERYDQDAASYFERPVGAEPAEVTGWWDTGVSVALVEELDPHEFTLGDFEVTRVDRLLLVRHENLVALMQLHARSPTEDVDEVSALLQEIVAAMRDEAVGHLPRDTG